MNRNFLIVVSFFFFFSSCLEGQPKKMGEWDATGGDVLTDGGGEDVFWGEDTADETMGVEFAWAESPPTPPPKKRIETVVVEPACEPADCDDANACTDDACDPATGCVYANNTQPCDDANACTAGDICVDGTCMGTAVDCDDEDPCTADSCFSVSGCSHKLLPGCGEEIIVDLCKEVDCDDANACTDDACDPATGCVYANNTQPCDDGNACTAGDICVDGTCSGTAIDCDDGDACTDDTCDPTTGCVFTPNTKPCDDGNLYTDDICDPATGCVHTPHPLECADIVGYTFLGGEVEGVVVVYEYASGDKASPEAVECCQVDKGGWNIATPKGNMVSTTIIFPKGFNCSNHLLCLHECGYIDGKYWLPINQYTPPETAGVNVCVCKNDVDAWGPDGPIYE